MTIVRSVGAILVACASAVSLSAEPQDVVGVVSDTICGASHTAMASQIGVDDKECTIQCVKSGAKYVLAARIDGKNRNLTITNPEFPDLEKHAGERVTIVGEIKGGTISIVRIEKAPAS
jgi:hypothetical protein